MSEPFLYKNLKSGITGITSLSFNSIDHLASTGLDNTITIWNLKSLDKTKKVSTHIDKITRIAFSPSNPLTCATASKDQTIRLWNDIRKDEYITLLGHNSSVSTFVFSSLGDYIYSGDEDGKIYAWKLCGQPEYTLLAKEAYGITAIQITQDSSILMYGLANGQLKFVNLMKTSIYCIFDGPKEGESLTSLALHPEQVVVAAGYSDGFIRVFDLTNREVMFEYKAHQGKVNDIKFQPLKRYLVSVGDDMLIQIRDLKTGKIEYSLQAHNNKILCLDFHYHGNTFASGDLEGNIAIWKFEEDRPITPPQAVNYITEDVAQRDGFGVSDTLQSKLATIDTIISRVMDSLDIMHRMTDQNTRQLKYVQDYIDLQKAEL